MNFCFLTLVWVVSRFPQVVEGISHKKLHGNSENSTLSLRWVDYIKKNATVCHRPEDGTVLCRSFVHLVFAAQVADPTHVLVGGATYSIDGGKTYQSGRSITFERHLVTGICGGGHGCDNNTDSIYQMFNWGYESTSMTPDDAPKTMCVNIWAIDTKTGQRGSLSIPCLILTETSLTSRSAPPISAALNSFSSAYTSVCSKISGLCRTNLHVVFTVSPRNPVAKLVGGMTYSFDDGNTWHSDWSSTFYEQHIDFGSNHTWSQAWQADVDIIGDRAHVHRGSGSRACWRVWVADVTTGETVFLKGSDGLHCFPICNTLVPFHNPAGYCPQKSHS